MRHDKITLHAHAHNNYCYDDSILESECVN